MNEWLRNTASTYLALSYIRTRQFPVPFPDTFRKVLGSKSMTASRAHCEASGWSVWKRSFTMGAVSSHHFTPTGKWFSTGYWREQVKQQAYSSSLFVLWHRGVYPAPQRHGSLLWAVARSHGGGRGTAAYWHPRCCPLNTLGERKAGSLLGWHESAAHLQWAAGIFRLAAFFVLYVWHFHIIHFGVSFTLFTFMPINLNKLSSSRTVKDRTYCIKTQVIICIRRHPSSQAVLIHCS